MKFNLNDNVKVRLTEKGIHKIVENTNQDYMPIEFHTCYKIEKQKLNANNEKVMQMHDFMDQFGGLGMRLPDYVSLNIEILNGD